MEKHYNDLMFKRMILNYTVNGLPGASSPRGLTRGVPFNPRSVVDAVRRVQPSGGRNGNRVASQLSSPHLLLISSPKLFFQILSTELFFCSLITSIINSETVFSTRLPIYICTLLHHTWLQLLHSLGLHCHHFCYFFFTRSHLFIYIYAPCLTIYSVSYHLIN